MQTTTPPLQERVFLFRRRFTSRQRRARGIFDAMPLLDVVLILFLFFIIQSSFIVQPGIRITLPIAEFADGATYGGLVVTLSQEGMVFFNDERTTLDGLAEAFKRAVYESPGATLLIEADARVRNQSLVSVYSMAREAGIGEVILSNRMAQPAVEPAP